MDNVAPVLEVKSKRIGGATYQVPVEISKSRRMALAMRWIIQYSKTRKGQTMADRLAAELIAASNNEGSSIKRRKIHIKWLKQIKLLLILGSQNYGK